MKLPDGAVTIGKAEVWNYVVGSHSGQHACTTELVGGFLRICRGVSGMFSG